MEEWRQELVCVDLQGVKSGETIYRVGALRAETGGRRGPDIKGPGMPC